jgi:hypothetical protein
MVTQDRDGLVVLLFVVRVALYCTAAELNEMGSEHVLLLAVAVLTFIGHVLYYCNGASPWTSWVSSTFF